MTKKSSLTLMLLLIMFATEAKNTTCRENVDVTVVHSGIQNNSEVRSQSISADITGHTLTISFNANVGIAHIVIKDSEGVYIDRKNVLSTPDYASFTINDAGFYSMLITLSNGEQYYGYFRVEN